MGFWELMPGRWTRAGSHTDDCHHSPYPGAQENREDQTGWKWVSGKVGKGAEMGVDGRQGQK